MNLGIILLVVLSFHRSIAQMPAECSGAYYRLPDNSDITVICGHNNIQIFIKLCPVYYANFDPNKLALNGKHNLSSCLGTMDNSTGNPEAKFTLLLDSSSSNECGNIIELKTESIASGTFGGFSSLDMVVFSGFVDSAPITEAAIVSYSTNLYYNFSCHYPLQYLLYNTDLLTSFGAVAVNNNNGSFISTLRMQIFTDSNFTTVTPSNGTVYGLKQTIYVQVSSNNSATSYTVYLDRCFATPSPLVTTAEADSYNFFIACNVSDKAAIISRGVEKLARFSFESFRFVQHNGQKTSTIYLHCYTRLCQPEACPKCTSRRRREADAGSTAGPAVVSYGPIYINDPATYETPSLLSGKTGRCAEIQTGLLLTLIIVSINTLKIF